MPPNAIHFKRTGKSSDAPKRQTKQVTQRRYKYGLIKGGQFERKQSSNRFGSLFKGFKAKPSHFPQ